mmetsp:Transcript_59424/g.112152  ORF Transcript_59424/g.112152 Transcript_59424/m.112152 type:complete len:202 (-) Transcript_59424:101-706(-)
MRRSLATTNPKVGNWHGPYDTTPECVSWNFPCRSLVWKRVKAAPVRRSSSDRASTASASCLLGATRVVHARKTLLRSTSENLARRMRNPRVFPPGAAVHTSMTSNAMFSPSRSQSSQSTSQSAHRACSWSCCSLALNFSGTNFSTSASNKSTGAQDPHLRFEPLKSISIKWPCTDVTRMTACSWGWPNAATIPLHSVMGLS